MQFRPATLDDLAAMRPTLPARYWRLLVQQLSGTLTWTLWAQDERQALCGVDPLPGGALECWLVMRSDRRPRPAVIRTLLMRIAIEFPDRVVIARIRDSNRAGQRMAELAGFHATAETMAGTDARTWLRPPLISETPHTPPAA